MPNARPEAWTSACLLSLTAVLLGQALQASDGHQSPEAMAWLTVACLTAVGALAGPAWAALERFGPSGPAAVLLVGLTLGFAQLFSRSPAVSIRPFAGFALFPVLGAAAVVAGTAGVLRRASWVQPAALTFLFLIAGASILRGSPKPWIDVFVFQQQSVDALLHAHNPYALTFPNIYGNTAFFGPGVADTRTLFFGFPYPPLSLVFALPGALVTGDSRASQLFALAVAAACCVALRPGRLGALAAAALLFTPRVFFVLEQAWTEPFGIALLGLTLVCVVRAPRLMPYTLGLLLGFKQYTVILLPLTVLLVEPFSWCAWGALLLRAGVTAAAVTLPFFLWNPAAFWRSVVWLQTVQPFRPDALGFPAWLAAQGHSPPPVVLTFAIATALATVLVLARAPRSPAGFASACTLVLLVFFAFNKQAFCNSYFLVIGAACLAVAAPRTREFGASAR